MSELSLLSKELFYNLMNTAGEQIICGNYALNFCCEQVQCFTHGDTRSNERQTPAPICVEDFAKNHSGKLSDLNPVPRK